MASSGIYFFGKDDLVFDDSSIVDVFKLHAATIRDHLVRDAREIVQRKLTQALFKLTNASSNKVLTRARRLILSVLAEVSLSGGFLQVFGNTNVQLVAQLFNFLFQPFHDW